MRKWSVLVVVLAMVVFLTSCSVKRLDGEKTADLDFTVVTEDNIPQELKEAIDERKSEEFQLTYCNENYLYITQGYGEKPTGGYSIKVNQVYLATESIHINLDLFGPQADNDKKGTSYPYIVLKLERRTEPVVFD